MKAIVVTDQAIVMPVLNFLSITFVVGFQPKKERTVPWIR
jgi:hypothetical protein